MFPLAVNAGARIPHDGDPLFGQVMLLLNGTSVVTKDDSSFNRAMTAFGGMALNSGVTLFGNPTYEAPTSGAASWLRCDDVTWAGSFGTQEWCIEGFYMPLQNVDDSAVNRLGAVFETMRAPSGKLFCSCKNLDNTSYTIDSGSALSLSTWYYYAFVRDNSLSLSVLRMYFGQPGGSAVQTGSFTGIVASNAVGSSQGSPKEAFGLSLTNRNHGRFGPFRFTIGNARYYSGTAFPVPSGPFPAR